MIRPLRRHFRFKRPQITLVGLFFAVTFFALLAASVGEFRRINLGHRDVCGLTYSADGSTLAVLYDEGTVEVWQSETGRQLATIQSAAEFGAATVRLSKEGRVLAVAVDLPGSVIEVWDLQGRDKTTLRINGYQLNRAAIAFSPTLELLAIAGIRDARIAIFDYSQFPIQCVAEVGNLHEPKNVDLRISPDGKRLAEVKSGAIQFWDLRGAAGSPDVQISGGFRVSRFPPLEAGQLSFSPDGKTLAIWTGDGNGVGGANEIRVCNIEVGEPKLLTNTLSGFETLDSLAFLPRANRGRQVLAIADGRLHLIDTETGKRIHYADDPIEASYVAAGAKGATFATAQSNTVTIWSAESLSVRTTIGGDPHPFGLMLSFAGCFGLFFVWMIMQVTRRRAACQTCGQTFYRSHRRDPALECPDCQHWARRERLSVAELQLENEPVTSNRTIVLLLVMAALAVPCAAALAAWYDISFGAAFAIMVLAIGLMHSLGQRALAWILYGFRLPGSKARRATARAFAIDNLTRCGPVMVWNAPETTLTNDLQRQVEICEARLAGAIDSPVRVLEGLQILCFRDETTYRTVIWGQWPPTLGMSHPVSMCFPPPWRQIVLCEQAIRELSPEPVAFVRGEILSDLIYTHGFRRPANWLTTGLVGVLADDEHDQKLADLNRKVLPAIRAGTTVSAADLFDCTKHGWSRRIGNSDHQAAFAAFHQRVHEAWSVMEFLCGKAATDERRDCFRRFCGDLRDNLPNEKTFRRHFSYGFDELLAQWRAWVLEQGLGTHEAPPAEFVKLLRAGPVATVNDESIRFRERVVAIRRLGIAGYVVGADSLIQILLERDPRLVPSAAWSLEAISGLRGGADVEFWEAWWESVPEEAKAI